MKIAIIGAGIYGCHLALKLKNEGHEIDLYEMSDDIFSGASRDNSFRIHKGYHYPRSAKTRNMCQYDEKRFCREYGHLVDNAKKHPKIFCVANDEKTLIDYNTMKIIMHGSKLKYKELTPLELKNMGFNNVEGGFRVFEAIFLVDEAKKWFKQILLKKGVNVKLKSYVNKLAVAENDNIIINNEKYDYVINCTYNQALQYRSKYKHYFDLCFSLIVASRKSKSECKMESFGVFDGAYPSLEPYGYKKLPSQYQKYSDRKVFQIFHVKHTSVAKFTNISEARKIKKRGLSPEKTLDLTNKILLDTIKFYPNFHDEFEVIGNCLSIKTKVDNLTDVRPLMVKIDQDKHSRLIQVFSSKLTSIFSAEDMVMKLLNKPISKVNACAA